MRSRFLFVPIIALAIALSIAAFMKWNSQDGGRQTSVGPTGNMEGTVAQATYVGGQSCAACHKPEYDLWSGSHHDLAMQMANESHRWGVRSCNPTPLPRPSSIVVPPRG